MKPPTPLKQCTPQLVPIQLSIYCSQWTASLQQQMTMAEMAAAIACFLVVLVAADPDPVQDFCIPYPGPGCKNASAVTAGDFIFSGIRSPGNTSATGFSGVSVTPAQFPGLNTLGMSFVRADLAPGGVNPPHYHPRATETALVVEGTVYSGFVDSGGRIFAAVIGKGEVMVFPRGMLHFQMNVGDSPATIFGTFNSQNPGLIRIPGAVFGSGIKEELLERAFGLRLEELERLKRRLGPKGEVAEFGV